MNYSWTRKLDTQNEVPTDWAEKKKIWDIFSTTPDKSFIWYTDTKIHL